MEAMDTNEGAMTLSHAIAVCRANGNDVVAADALKKIDEQIGRAKSALGTLASTEPATLDRAVEDVAAAVETLSVTGAELEMEIARINSERAQLVGTLESLMRFTRRILQEPSIDPKAAKQWDGFVRALAPHVYDRADETL
jgi:hypothetical protein